VSAQDAIAGVVVQVVWLLLVGALIALLWRRAVARFSAVGS
jgi:ABC-type uncharacterized transport system permease subunit